MRQQQLDLAVRMKKTVSSMKKAVSSLQTLSRRATAEEVRGLRRFRPLACATMCPCPCAPLRS